MNYQTGLPLRGLLPILIENLKSFRDGWWLNLILVAAVLGIAPALKANATVSLIVIGSIIAGYTIALWRTYQFTRDDTVIRVKTGLAEKNRVTLSPTNISRVDRQRDQWCLLLGLVIVELHTEGSEDAAVKIPYITPRMAQRLIGDLDVEPSADHSSEFRFKLSIPDSIKGALLVPNKHMIGPALILVAIALPFLSSTAQRPDELLMDETSVEQASTILSSTVHPGTIGAIILMTGLFLIGVSVIARVFYALPYFLGTQVDVSDTHIRVQSGIFNLRRWQLRLTDLASIEVREGVWARLFRGSPVLLQTRGAKMRSGMSGYYIPFVSNEKLQELLERIDIQPGELPERRLNVFNFLMDMARITAGGTAIVIGIVLFLPVSFWDSPILPFYAAEIGCIYLLATMFCWRRHWNSGLRVSTGNITVGQCRWTRNRTLAKLEDLHGFEVITIPLLNNHVLAVRPGLPGVDERVTATTECTPGNLSASHLSSL